MKPTYRLIIFIFFWSLSSHVFAQAEILVHLEPGTPQDTINAYLADLQAIEIAASPLSEVRLWEVPDTLIKGTDTIFAAESPRYASRRPKIKETSPNYQTFIPATTPGTHENPPFPCPWGYLVPPGDGCEVVIGLIDTGIDTSHSYYNGKEFYFWDNADEIPGNGLDDDGNGYVDDVTGWNFVDTTANPADSNSHGTHIAGSMIQIFEMTRAIGPPPPIRIMNLKTQGKDGTGSLFDLILAVDYAAVNGANILNLSLGYIDTAAINDTIPAALAHSLQVAKDYANVLAVCAAGNESIDIDTFRHYPGAFTLPHILTISSSNCEDTLSLFSNYGDINSDIGAPGEEFFSTTPMEGYENKSGTSMASGFVSAISALLATHMGGSGCTGDMSVFDPLEIKRAILVSARVVPGFIDTVKTDGIIFPILALDSLRARFGQMRGQAWKDNGDGIRVGGEDSIAGIPVFLVDASGTRPLMLDSTDSMGRYSFENLPPVPYKLRFLGQTDTLALSYPGSGSIPDPISGLSDTIFVSPSDSLVDLDAGYYTPLRLGIKAFLEGPYNSTTGKMNHDLLSQELVPYYEPFSAIDSDTLTFGKNTNIANYLTSTLSDSSTIDWGIMEWRSGSDSTILNARLPVILRADGRVVLPSGHDPYLPGTGTSSLFIGLRFYGHLQIMTSSSYSPGGGGLVDFSITGTGVTSSDARVSLSATSLGLTSGDEDGDGVIDASDRAKTWNARNSTGYLPGDVNRDGAVDAADRAAAWNNRNKLSVIP